MQDFIIDEEFKHLLPPLLQDEYDGLEKSIQEVGCTEPLVIWQEENILLDGHNRYEICKKHNIEFNVRYVSLPDRLSAVYWIVDNQKSRRNLTLAQKAELALKLLEIEKQFARERQLSQLKPFQNNKVESDRLSGGKFTTTVEGAPSEDLVEKGRSTDIVAKKFNISEKTLRNAKKIVDMAKEDEEIAEEWQKAKLGESSINAVFNKVKEKEKRERFEEEKQKIAVQVKESPNAPVVELCDAITWLNNQTEQCDLLLTDPPYSTDVDDIEKFANSWLPLALSKVKPTGRAYIFVGAYPQELKAYLDVRMPTQILVWTYKNTLGPTPLKDYKQNWQAILYYRFDESPDLNCPIMLEQFSVQEVNAPDGRQFNRYHEWQKPDEIAERFIRHATKEGDVVFDPFVGTGTFLLAAAKLGRIGKGCDNNEENLKIAESRGCILKSTISL
jgi:hypothetical protein